MTSCKKNIKLKGTWTTGLAKTTTYHVCASVRRFYQVKITGKTSEHINV